MWEESFIMLFLSQLYFTAHLRPIHMEILGGFDAELDVIAFDAKHLHDDVIADEDGFV
jgi:hypothetical protein